MLSSVEQEARHLAAAADLADARKRFSDIVFRANELIIERQTEFWKAFVATYAAVAQQAPSGSDKQGVHATLLDEIKTFVAGKDHP